LTRPAENLLLNPTKKCTGQLGVVGFATFAADKENQPQKRQNSGAHIRTNFDPIFSPFQAFTQDLYHAHDFIVYLFYEHFPLKALYLMTSHNMYAYNI